MVAGKLRQRQGQLGSRKSNDGCITCKIRKIKCDELRPYCKRCLTTGRKCDGYIRTDKIHGRQSAENAATMYMKQIPTYENVEGIEVRCFEYFIQQVVPKSSHLVDGNFWRQLVPQMCHSDPIIWNAVISLSYLIQGSQHLHTFLLPGTKRPIAIDGEHRKALTWYGRSIAELRLRLKQSTTRSSTAVISSILYICIECMQRNEAQAIALYQRAVAMMGVLGERQTPGHHVTSSDAHLESAVRALLHNMSTSQRLPIDQKAITEQTETIFPSLADARARLSDLVFAAHDFVMDVRTIIFNQGKDWIPPPELVARQRQLQAHFAKWYSAFEPMTTISESTSEVEAYSLPHVAYGHYFILLSTHLDMYETVYDDYLPHFQAIVDHAGRIIATNKGKSRALFMFETRVIPTLFAVAVKCRHPIVRRQAISLLRCGTKMENTWDADLMAELAEWSVAIEESGDIHGKFSLQPASMDFPSEHNRINWSQFVELEDADGRPAMFHQIRKWQQDDCHEWFMAEHMVKIEVPDPSSH